MADDIAGLQFLQHLVDGGLQRIDSKGRQPRLAETLLHSSQMLGGNDPFQALTKRRGKIKERIGHGN